MNGHVFAEQGDKIHFIGDFEALYSSDDDPWFQSGAASPMSDYYEHSRRTLASALQIHAYGKGLEIGCGHGHLTAMLQRRLMNRMTGIDVSPAAIAKAKALYPGEQWMRFLVGDITSDQFAPPGKHTFAIWGQILWYLLHAVDKALENTLRCIEPGGLFVVSQAFLAGEQRYGADVIDGFNGALSLFHARYRDRLQLIEARYDDTERYLHRDGLLVFRVK